MKEKKEVVIWLTFCHFSHFQGLFKLHLQDGEEIYLQAGGPEDRDRWAHALGAVIRSLSTSGKAGVL